MIRIDKKEVNLPVKRKILTAMLQKKISYRTFHRKTYVTLFCVFVYNILSKVQYFVQSCKSEQKGISSLL